VEGFGTQEAVIRSNALGVEGADTADNQFYYQIPDVLSDDSVEIEVEVLGDLTNMRGFITAFIGLRGNGTQTGGYVIWMQILGELKRPALASRGMTSVFL